MVEKIKERYEAIDDIKKPSRTMELVFGILGGFFGLIGGIAAIVIGSFGEAFNFAGYSDIMILGTVAIVVSITGVVGAVLVKKNPKLGGSIMVLSGIMGFICIFVFYILGGIFMVIGGLMALIRK